MNIVLIGMPGCGKSTVGVLLAKAVQYDFIDCDLIIQKRFGTGLQELIDSRGLDAFLACEEETVLSVSADRAVIATGGSAVYSDRAMEQLKRNAVTVYLSLPCEEIERRLTNIRSRGVAMSKGDTVASLYEKRCPLYEKYADITLDASGLGLEETVERVVALLRERIGGSDAENG